MKIVDTQTKLNLTDDLNEEKKNCFLLHDQNTNYCLVITNVRYEESESKQLKQLVLKRQKQN